MRIVKNRTKNAVPWNSQITIHQYEGRVSVASCKRKWGVKPGLSRSMGLVVNKTKDAKLLDAENNRKGVKLLLSLME